ncbi:MAG: DUF4367 domain-containing protein [Anaerolineae bacterium]|jgi:hypothetical protein
MTQSEQARIEQARAEQVSAAVDALLRDPDARVEGLDPEDADLLAPARRLARLPALLGTVDPALEAQVMHKVRGRFPNRPYGGRAVRRVWRPARLGWAAAAVAASLLLVVLLTPLDETVMASFLSVFSLGRTEVQVAQVGTPALPAGTRVREVWTLAEARAQVPFSIPEPAYLPEGYDLEEVYSYTYPDLPAWVPQPFSIELLYDNGEGRTCALRVYPIMLGQEATISGMNLEATSIQQVEDVDVRGRPGVLLHLGASWREVVWEDGELILAVRSTDLTEEELLRIARSVGW